MTCRGSGKQQAVKWRENSNSLNSRWLNEGDSANPLAGSKWRGKPLAGGSA